jgi:pilus assembly protein CpaF
MLLREKLNAAAANNVPDQPIVLTKRVEVEKPSVVKRVVDHASGKVRADRSANFRALRATLHSKLISEIDLKAMNKMPDDQVRVELKKVAEELIAESQVSVNAKERDVLIAELQDEVLGLGPLESLLKDERISDILVNGHDSVYIERAGLLEKTNVTFDSDKHLLKIIDRIVSRVGRRIDESSPMVDARLADGSRVNAIIPPLALDGPCLSIRRFGTKPLEMKNLVKNGSITKAMAELVEGMVKARLNILISGGTGSGKTTFLNIMSGYIPENERIVTIEDAAELQLQQPHVARLETRPANIEGNGAIGQRELVKNSLRMRPDRIVVGEVRGSEAFDMLQAMNTGHEGSMTTVHANTPRDALARVENMIGMAGFDLPQKAIRQQIASAITVVVQIARLSDGTRKLMNISEITGMEGEIITMQDIFTFEQTGVDRKGRVQGEMKPTGVRPKFISELESHGVAISPNLFDPTRKIR